MSVVPLHSDLIRVRMDPDLQTEEAADIVARYFMDWEAIAAVGGALKEVYPVLRRDPALSRAVFDKLVNAHNNSVAAASTPSATFIAGCCCCGWDTETQPTPLWDSGPVEERTADSTSPLSKFLEAQLIRATEGPLRPAEKERGINVQQLYSHLTSWTLISDQDRERLYQLLQSNEVLGAGLFETAVAGSRLLALAVAPDVADSPVVLRLRQAFVNPSGGGGGGGGGGCCCCCCCCCCGGCCGCGGDC